MSAKSEVITWGLILGGMAAAGFLGYRAIGNLFSGGNLDPLSLLGIGSHAGGTDIFGNTTVAQVQRTLNEAKAAVSEQNANLINSRQMMEKYDYGAELEQAFAAYDKEISEYNAMLAALNPTYGFWTGKEDAETQAYRAAMTKEYEEALPAHNTYREALTKWQAVNA